MTYKQIRDIIQNQYMEFPNMKWKSKYSVINDGFPGTFNLSLSEPELLDEYGNYLDYDKPLIFAKIQPVIRPNDFEQIISNFPDKSHLALFELAGFSVADPDASKQKNYLQDAVNLLWALLINKLGLNPNNLYIKICAGGKIENLTAGKYKINKAIPKDISSYKLWKELGVPEKNFIWDSTRDSFLSLLMFGRPSPWGYRCELLYNIGEERQEDLLDIGTIEYFLWRPIFENNRHERFAPHMVNNIAPLNSALVAGGIGVERALFVVNRLNSIVESDHINPLYQTILNDAIEKLEVKAFIATETLRVCHRVLTDGEGYTNLSETRQNHLVSYLKALHSSLLKLGVPLKKIKDYLAMNAQLQSIYPELQNYDFIAREIAYAFERRFEEYPAWPRAEFYEGTEGLLRISKEILKEKGKTIDAIVSSKILHAIPFFHKDFRNIRIKRHIFLRAIVDKTKEAEERKAEDKSELRKIKFKDDIIGNSNSAIYIYGNKLAIITAAERERGGIIIENKEVADIVGKLFESTWQSIKD